MDVKQLECFVHLAENLSFSTTAQMMYLTQPAVSGQIKSLESELKVTLFHRNKRTVQLTPAGESFYRDTKDILERLNQAKLRARYNAKKYAEKYVISYEDNILAVRFLSRLISQFKQIHPEIFLELKVTPYNVKNQLYLDHKIDFMFTVNEGIDHLTDIRFEELYVGEYVCVLPKDHPLSVKQSLDMEDLQGEQLVLLNPINAPAEMKRMLTTLDTVCVYTPKIFCDSVFSGYTLVKSGFGLAIMPDFVCLDDSDVCILPLSSGEKISYGVAWNKNRTTKAMSDLISAAKQVYASS